MTAITSLASRLRRWLLEESGNATIEFVIVVPVVFMMFASSMESGVHSIRQVLLDRALDLTVRDVRVGFLPSPTHEELTARMCEYSLIIPNCKQDVRLEMIVADPRDWKPISASVSCRDREEEDPPEITLANGANNELMILRACVLFDPVLPGGGLGRKLEVVEGTGYAITSTLAYVLEPYQ